MVSSDPGMIHPQVLDNTTDPAAIIACPGIGARFLGGIEDKDVYPVRGQTILLRAPWIKYGRTLSRGDGSYVYMMPRHAGHVRVCFVCGPQEMTQSQTGARWWDQGAQ